METGSEGAAMAIETAEKTMLTDNRIASIFFFIVSIIPFTAFKNLKSWKPL